MLKQPLLWYHQAARRLSDLSPRQRTILAESATWAIFLAVLVWFYRIPPWMWSTHLPQRGDPLEALWQIEFWRSTVLTGDFQIVSTSAMYPLGVHQMTIAHAGVGLLLLPFSLTFGSAVALNTGFVGGFILCFLGARHFLRQLTPSALLAGIGATIFTFALGRTLHAHGHLHVLLASTFGVWMAGLLLRLRQQITGQRVWAYAVCSGLLWGLAIIAQPYGLFWGALLIMLPGRERRAWLYAPVIVISALVISGPFLFGALQGSAYMSSPGPSLSQLVYFRMVPTSYVGWGVLSPWKFLTDLSRLWQQTLPEQRVQNWGLLTLLLATAAVVTVRRNRHTRVMLVLLIVSIFLSLGPLWKDPPVSSNVIEKINTPLWQLGSQLKPDLFDARAESLKLSTLPLPAVGPVILVPRYEYARISRRYSIWVGLAAVGLAIVFLTCLPRKWAVAIGCLWMLELLPAPRHPQAIPTQPHPAHVWAAEQLRKQDDRGVYSPPGMLYAYSHDLAGRLPGVSTFGSFPPGYMRYTDPWIQFSHFPVDPAAQALVEPAYTAILRRAQVSIVLLRPKAAELAKQNSALRFVQCFDPQSADLSHYYPDPLCAFEVLPGKDDFFTIQPVSGFSTFEPNFVWVEGTRAKAGWRAARPKAQMIELALRAYCPPESQQSVVIKLNGQPLAQHTWTGNCWGLWVTTLTVSPQQLNAGWNTLEFEAASAAQPYLYDANSQDRRNLSVSVERLRVSPIQAPRRPGGAARRRRPAL